MCIFNTKAQPNSFALSTEGKLVIGSVNTIQKLDIKSFPLKDGDMGMRIAHSMDFRVFGILSTKIYVVGRYNDSSDGGNAGTASSRDKGKGRVVVEEMVIDGSSGSAAAVDEKMVGQECEESYFKIFNDQSFDEMDKWCMDKDENVQCIKAAFLATEEIPLPISNNEPTVGGGGNGGEVDDTDIVMDNQASTSSSSEGPHHSASSSSEQRLSPYFVVGTAYLDAMNEESTRGRILLFAVENGKISLVASLEVNGAVYDVAVVNGRIVAAINSKVIVFSSLIMRGVIFIHFLPSGRPL